MSKRRKLIAAKDRARKLAEREVEAQDLKARYAELRSRTGGFGRSLLTAEQKQELKQDLRRKEALYKEGSRFAPLSRLPAKYDGAPFQKEKPVLVIEGSELLKREKVASAKAEALKLQVAPLYNKGGYQFMTGEDLKDFQAGKTRRR